MFLGQRVGQPGRPACRPASRPAGRPAGQPANQPISLFQMDIPFSNGYVHLKKGCPFEKGKSAGWPAGRLAGRQAGWLAGVFKAPSSNFSEAEKHKKIQPKKSFRGGQIQNAGFILD